MKLFLFGILFCAIVLPILDGMQNIIAQTVQFLCTKIALATAKVNAELVKYAGAQDQGEDERNPIGFAVSAISTDEIGGDEEEYEEEE